MIIDIKIQIEDDLVTINVPHYNLHKTIKNLVITGTKDESTVLDVGKTLDEIEFSQRETWRSYFENLETKPLYTSTAFDVDSTDVLLQFAISQIQQDYREFVGARLFRELRDKFHFHLTLLDYEAVSLELRHQFEYSVLIQTQTPQLTFNGREIDLLRDQGKNPKHERFKLTTAIAMPFIGGIGCTFIFAAIGIRIVEVLILTGLFTGYEPWVRLFGMGGGFALGYLLIPLVWVLILKPILSFSEIDKFMSGFDSRFAQRARKIIHQFKRW